jgi:hypothetical protein
MPVDVKRTWKKFVEGIRSLLSDLPEHRHQDQFLKAKEAALALAESEEMATHVDSATPNAELRIGDVGSKTTCILTRD